MNLRVGGSTALTFLRFAKDMLTALAALASFGLTFRNMRASGWLLSAALLVYLGWYYAVMPVLKLPSALLPLVIMIIAAYVGGAPRALDVHGGYGSRGTRLRHRRDTPIFGYSTPNLFESGAIYVVML